MTEPATLHLEVIAHADPEITAMSVVVKAMEQLTDLQRERVLSWALNKYTACDTLPHSQTTETVAADLAISPRRR